MPPPAAPPPPPAPRPRRGRFRTFVVRFARGTLLLFVAGASYIGYASWKQRNPGEQLGQDPSKPTVVVLGSGWASTSFIKDVDTSYVVETARPADCVPASSMWSSSRLATVGRQAEMRS